MRSLAYLWLCLLTVAGILAEEPWSTLIHSNDRERQSCSSGVPCGSGMCCQNVGDTCCGAAGCCALATPHCCSTICCPDSRPYCCPGPSCSSSSTCSSASPTRAALPSASQTSTLTSVEGGFAPFSCANLQCDAGDTCCSGRFCCPANTPVCSYGDSSGGCCSVGEVPCRSSCCYQFAACHNGVCVLPIWAIVAIPTALVANIALVLAGVCGAVAVTRCVQKLRNNRPGITGEMSGNREF